MTTLRELQRRFDRLQAATIQRSIWPQGWERDGVQFVVTNQYGGGYLTMTDPARMSEVLKVLIECGFVESARPGDPLWPLHEWILANISPVEREEPEQLEIAVNDTPEDDRAYGV